MWEPVSSTKTRSWLGKSADCLRHAVRSASFCSLALIVFFFASSPELAWHA